MLMKDFFTLCLAMIATLAVQAQDNFPLQFADKDGNIIADGSIIDLTNVEDDGFGDVQMPSGLYVKNNSDATVQCAGSFTVQAISNGVFQSCFPASCMSASTVGDHTTQNGPLEAGTLKDMNTEWLPETEGTCTVVYQLVTYKQNTITKVWSEDQRGPTITMNFSYNPSNVSTTKGGKAVRSVSYYSLTGREVKNPTHGVFIAKKFYTDGTMRCTKVNR